MPTAEHPHLSLTPTGPRYEVRPSLVMELVWITMLHPGEPTPEYPVRADRFATAPGLEQRIAAMWPDGEICFTEAFVLADRGGVLFEQDPETLWAGLAAGAVAEPRFEELASESPEEQIIFRNRVTALHDDAELRDRWLQLLKDAWEAVEEGWQREGRPGVEAFSWELKGKLRTSPEGVLADLETLVHCDFQGRLTRLAEDTGYRVVVTPAWFGRKGFYVSLNDVLIAGPSTPIRAVGPTAETRNRARRFKALGDPTRLAILEATACRPRTVGELAEEMGVAQPTVSNHVRTLREAGLLVQVKDGSRRLQPDPSALKQLADEAVHAVRSEPGITVLD